MSELKNRVFYSTKSKRLFVIPNYYTHGTGYAVNLLENIKSVVDFMVEKFGAERDKIITSEILVSNRYKYMWCFEVDYPHAALFARTDYFKTDLDVWTFIK